MMDADASRRPRAVALLDPADAAGAIERVRRPFLSCAEEPVVWHEGPMTVALSGAPELDLHVSERTLCLVDGALYVIPELGGDTDPGARPAARLAAAYERLGDEVFSKLRGEFWALLWRRDRLEGVVVADQLGCRAPYWHQQGSAVALASEVAELLGVLRRRPPPDELALAHWLMITGPRPGSTLFTGVRSVRAGHCLRLAERGCRELRYWNLDERDPVGGDRSEQAARLRDALDVAVARRRREDDAAVGVLLSGGLDSSAVAGLASRQGRVRGYSVVFPHHPAMDESALISRTAQQLEVDSTRLVVRGGSLVGGALTYLAAWQHPPTSPNLFFWNPLLAQAASDGIEVMLDGEGGDELFGFSPYLVADRLSHGRLLSALALSRRWAGEPDPPSRELVRLRLRLAGAAALLPAAIDRRLGARRPAPSWLPASVARQWIDTDDSGYAWKTIPGPRWRAYIVDLVTRGAGPSVVYEQARRRCGLVGITARHPLVDVDVVELVLRLDPELGFDRRFNRPMLREAIAGLVPDEVRLRRGKSNFDALFHEILLGPELEVVRDLLDPARCQLRGYVDSAALYDELMNRGAPTDRGAPGVWAVRVWRAVTAECWLRGELEPEAFSRLRASLEGAQSQPTFERRFAR